MPKVCSACRGTGLSGNDLPCAHCAPKPKPLTVKEKAAIRKLERLAATWPKSLWLFSGSGPIYVMKKNAKGEQAVRPGMGGGVDQAFIVATIDIECDGGDW